MRINVLVSDTLTSKDIRFPYYTTKGKYTKHTHFMINPLAVESWCWNENPYWSEQGLIDIVGTPISKAEWVKQIKEYRDAILDGTNAEYFMKREENWDLTRYWYIYYKKSDKCIQLDTNYYDMPIKEHITPPDAVPCSKRLFDKAFIKILKPYI